MPSEHFMNCICGHTDRDHVAGGRCRVPDCPCEHFQPGDTISAVCTQKQRRFEAGATGTVATNEDVARSGAARMRGRVADTLGEYKGDT